MYEGSVCTCCMSTDNLKDLFATNKVNYADMLKACLNIEISQADGHASLCERCCKKLQDCIDFKKQALKSISILSSIDLTALINEDELKHLGFVDNENEIEDIKRKEEESFESKEEVKKEKNKKRKLKDKRQSLRRKKTTRVKVRKTKRTKAKNVQIESKIPYKISKDDVKCRECGKEFGSSRTLRIHYNIHFGSFECTACHKKFMSQETLHKHQKTHLTGPFKCVECEKIFASIHTLRTHELSHQDRGARYKCDQCEDRFTNSLRRDKHKQTEHGNTEARFKCNDCGEKFMDAVKLSRHISNLHDLKLFPCPVCYVKFKPLNLRLHLLSTHRVGGGYRCPVPSCDAVYFFRSGLKKHLLSHFDDRRFFCRFCGTAFVQKNALRTHTKVHIRRGEFHGDPDSLVACVGNELDDYKCIQDESHTYKKSEQSPEIQSLGLESIDLDNELELHGILLDDDRFKLPSDLE